MPTYKPYPDSKTVPSRKTRKADRLRIFVFNKTVALKARKEARAARKLLQEQEGTEE